MLEEPVRISRSYRNDVAGQTAKILARPLFRETPQLAALMAFLVAQTLAGRAEHLDTRTLAVAVFGRDAAYDPQTDPIVRIQADRLQRRLERY